MAEPRRDDPNTLNHMNIQRNAGYVLPVQKQTKGILRVDHVTAMQMAREAAEDGRSQSLRQHKVGDEMLPESTGVESLNNPNMRAPNTATYLRKK